MKIFPIAYMAALSACVCPSFAQELWAPKGTPAQYKAPHQPITKIGDLKASHAGQKSWRQTIVDDEHLRSDYVWSSPGTKTPRALHPDTRAWWVVMEGQLRFDIEGQQPFTASKGSMVQVPMATLFSFETVGSEPALYFETNIAGAKTLYSSQVDTPKIPGLNFMPVRFTRTKGEYDKSNKPHQTFDDVARAIDEGRLKGTIRIVDDARGAANFIYGYEKNLPPINPKDKGHYHPEGAEYWLIMKGQIRYPVETKGVIIANEGDVVYVPKFTFHAPRWYGATASCRLAMNGYPFISHLFEPAPPK